MGQCYITRRGTKTGGTTEQLGVYPIGEDGRPTGDVVVPDGVTSLSSYVFRYNTNVSSVSLPNSLTSFKDYCFQECSLQNISIPDGVQTIPLRCFENCTKLKTITIPSACTLINDVAFSHCDALTDVIINENTSYELGISAFAYCSNLTNKSVHDIMEHYSTIGDSVFQECNGLTNVEVSRFWTKMFYNCTNLTTAKSLNAKNTGNSVFRGCKNLQEVYIADGTTTIGSQIFYGCTSLKKIYLPSSIVTATSSSLTSTSGSYYVFYNCTALEDVQLGQDWNMSLRLNVSNNLTVDSMIAMFNSLKDLTGDTAKTLTLGSTNLAKLTDEQRAIAINKNWTLA